MFRSQGKYFSEGELSRITFLLRETEMSLPDIASRMRCSRSAVAAVNRKFQIRVYDGKRSQWSLNWKKSFDQQDEPSVAIPKMTAVES